MSLRLAAFPYQKFGSIGAVVQEVAASSNLPDGAASYTEQFYRVTAVLESQNVMAYGRQQSLLPGMTLEADISLDHRSLLEWLLEPLFSIKGRL